MNRIAGTLGKPTRTRAAFTLVELLVVITILALLIALLLPALGKAKAAALQTMCLTRIRQATVALVTYTNDHRGQFPAFPVPQAPGPDQNSNQYGTWIPPMIPYVGGVVPISETTGLPMTGTDVTKYYPIIPELRNERYKALHCPSEVYGLWAIGSGPEAEYRHVFYGIQSGLRRHQGKPASDPASITPRRIDEFSKPSRIWAFSEAGYLADVTGVTIIRTYGFTVSIPADGMPRSTPQHDGYGISLSRLDGSAAFYHALQQYVPPDDVPWEYGSSWAPVWTSSGGGKWTTPSGLKFPTK